MNDPITFHRSFWAPPLQLPPKFEAIKAWLAAKPLQAKPAA